MPKLGILESLLRYDVHGAGRVDDSHPERDGAPSDHPSRFRHTTEMVRADSGSAELG